MPTPMVIDLSHWNTVKSFADVKKAGIVGVIHKATESTGYADDTYDSRMASAQSAGLLWGAYHFLRPGNMKTQAQFFVDVAGDIDLYAADHEDPAVDLDDLKEFLVQVEALTGVLPVIYSGHVLKEQLGSSADPELEKYLLWLAQYSSTPSWPTAIWPSYWIWQYTDQGSIAGMSGAVDLNQYQGTAEELVADWTGRAAPPPDMVVGEPPSVTISIETKGKVKVTVLTDEEA